MMARDRHDEGLLLEVFHRLLCFLYVTISQVLLLFSWSEQHTAHVLISVNERTMINQWGLKNWNSWWLHDGRLLKMKLVICVAHISENRTVQG